MALYVPFILYIKVYAPPLILPIQLQINWWCPGYLVDYIKIGFEHCSNIWFCQSVLLMWFILKWHLI